MGEKSMERTFELLDTVDIKSVIGVGKEMEVHDLMDILEVMLKDDVEKYPELEGFLFDNVSACEFIDYLVNRYENLHDREVIANYISVD